MLIIILTIPEYNRLIQSCDMEPITGTVFLHNSAFPGLTAAAVHLSRYCSKGFYPQAPQKYKNHPLLPSTIHNLAYIYYILSYMLLILMCEKQHTL